MTEQSARSREITTFQIRQEFLSCLLGSCSSHDLAAIHRLPLAVGFSRRSIRQKILAPDQPGMLSVRAQHQHQRRPFLHDPPPRVAMAVDPTLMALRQPKPALEIEIVQDLGDVVSTGEQAATKCDHQPYHMAVDRIGSLLESASQLLKPLLTLLADPRPRIQRRGHLHDLLHIPANRLLLASHQGQSTVDTTGQAAQLLLCEPPFFASKLRWIDSRTCPNPSAIRIPGG